MARSYWRKSADSFHFVYLFLAWYPGPRRPCPLNSFRSGVISWSTWISHIIPQTDLINSFLIRSPLVSGWKWPFLLLHENSASTVNIHLLKVIISPRSIVVINGSIWNRLEISSRWASWIEYLKIEGLCRTRRFNHEFSKLVLQLVFPITSYVPASPHLKTSCSTSFENLWLSFLVLKKPYSG